MKNFCLKKTTLFMIGLFIPNLYSGEFRDPLIFNTGPIRFFFEEPSDNISFRWWSTAYSRISSKAFSSEHGRNTTELSTLLFGGADFRVSSIFQNCLAKHENINYNPLLRTARLRLKTDYTETGFVVGARWDYPFYNKDGLAGRVGIKASVPFKSCRINKYDTEGVKSGAELQDVIFTTKLSRGNEENIITSNSAPANDSSSLSETTVSLVRLDFLEALPMNANKESFVNYELVKQSPVEYQVTLGSNNTSVKTTNGNLISTTNPSHTDLQSLASAAVGLIYTPEGQVPFAARNYMDPQAEDNGQVVEFPSDAKISGSNSIYAFVQNETPGKYKTLADSADKSVAQRIKDQDAKANVWAIPIAYRPVSGSGDKLDVDSGEYPLGTAVNLAQQVNSNVYEWFHDNGMDFESQPVNNIGDTSIELFWEQMLNDKTLAELNFGFVAPTSKKALYKNNPYQIYTGNGGHWEIAPGAKLAFKISNTVNLKIDGKYSWVISAVEERAATFKGSLIKNIGPKVDADVKWQYFVGNFDLNITHPSTASITGSLGYQIFYKREEKIKYGKEQMASWLGGVLTDVTIQGQAKKHYIDDLHSLDALAAAKNTNSVSHKLKFESSYLLSGWLEFYWGGSWAFAGKNSPESVDGYFGFHVAF